MSRRSSTGVRGVHKKGNLFGAVRYQNKNSIHLGYFRSIEEAKNAYDNWISASGKSHRRASDNHHDEWVSAEIREVVEKVFRMAKESHAKNA